MTRLSARTLAAVERQEHLEQPFDYCADVDEIFSMTIRRVRSRLTFMRLVVLPTNPAFHIEQGKK